MIAVGRLSKIIFTSAIVVLGLSIGISYILYPENYHSTSDDFGYSSKQFFERLETGSSNFNQSVSEFIRQVNPDIAAKLKIKIYTGKSISTANVIDVSITKPEIIYQHIDPTKPLVLYAHGFIEHPSNESVQTIVDAYLKRGSDNIFVLDWSNSAAGSYISVLRRIPDVAKITARSFDALVKLGLNFEKCHFVGHSMGSQLFHFFGRFSYNSIPRITALDPAFPGFYFIGIGHLNKNSAKFVDVIHTDGGLIGVGFNTGTVDFYANGGIRPQPGCAFLGFPLSSKDLCSHWRSWRFYAESINKKMVFTATQCTNYLSYKFGLCDLNKKVNVGYATPTNIEEGSYYFQTSEKFPFSKIA